MSDIGVYRVQRKKLIKPPEERTYREAAQFDPETGEWAEWSYQPIVDDAMGELDDDPSEYSREELLEAFRRGCHTTGTFVLPADEVPGEIEESGQRPSH